MTRLLLLLALQAACNPVRHIPDPGVQAPTVVQPPPKALAHYVRGRLALLDGDLGKADQSLSMARLFDPRSPWIPIAQGEVALVRGDVRAAAIAWQEATRVDPSCATAWLYRARVDRLQGRPEAAAGHYHKARELEHGWQAWAGEIDAWLHAGHRDQAAAVLAEWNAEATLLSAAAAERGHRRLQLGDPEGAAADLVLAVRAHPDDLGAVRRWVAAVLQCADQGPALAEVDRLQMLAPLATAPLWASAVLGDHAGDASRVSAALKQWAALAPDDATLRILREDILEGGSP